MPGITYAQSGSSGDVPFQLPYLLGGNLAPANANAALTALWLDDLVVLSTNATVSTNSVPVIRPLLQADVTASYLQGAGNTVGVLGVGIDSVITNALGQIISNPQQSTNIVPPVIFSMPAPSARIPPDVVTNRQRMNVILASPANFFKGRVPPTYAPGATPALDGTLAGISIVASAGGTTPVTYYVDPLAAVKILVISRCVETDKGYNVPNGSGLVIFQFLPAFCQSLTGLVYTSN